MGEVYSSEELVECLDALRVPDVVGIIGLLELLDVLLASEEAVVPIWEVCARLGISVMPETATFPEVSGGAGSTDD